MMERGRLAARIAWLRYFIAAEEFDRTLPGMWSPRHPDEWLVRPDYSSVSLSAAGKMSRDAVRNALADGANFEELEEERISLAQRTHTGAKEELLALLQEWELIQREECQPGTGIIMGPSAEARMMAKKLLEGNPRASALETDLAYALDAAGQAWLDKASKADNVPR